MIIPATSRDQLMFFVLLTMLFFVGLGIGSLLFDVWYFAKKLYKRWRERR
jgi:hypothetical protein